MATNETNITPKPSETSLLQKKARKKLEKLMQETRDRKISTTQNRIEMSPSQEKAKAKMAILLAENKKKAINFGPRITPKLSLQLEKAKKKVDILLEENKKLRNKLAIKNLQESGISEFIAEKDVLRDLQIDQKRLEELIEKEHIISISFQGKRLFLRKEISYINKRLNTETTKKKLTQLLAKLAQE